MESNETLPSTAQQAENNGSERVFTQKELNDIIAERLARERSKSAEREDSLTAKETDLKAREEALASKTKEFDAWTNRRKCEKYLEENNIHKKLLDRLDTSDFETFKAAVETVQKATNGGFTLKTVTTGAPVDNPPTWLWNGNSNQDNLKRAFGLKD